MPTKPVVYHLKYIQDVEVYHLIKGIKGATIGEIGANHSRILPDFSDNNDCYCIDTFEVSVGGGSTVKPEDVGYKFFDCFVGDSSTVISDNYFDILFSVSVVEHVPTKQLKQFFSDSLRMLKPGGFCIHLIDMYMSDNDLCGAEDRYAEYFNFLSEDNKACSPICPSVLVSPNDLKFSTAFATNPDNIMRNWNNIVPSLTQVREKSQSCSIIMGYYKPNPENNQITVGGQSWLSKKDLPQSIHELYGAE
ncbi:MAG: class I SAM-dependent methyltransferase [Xanthomonadales bacterium]|nr:class I SAM-dependent methyltransferase [Xanthomonadales bacterium]